MNKEVLFAKTLEEVRKTAKEQGNCISEEQVKEAFAELDLSGEQLQMVFDYLLKHKNRYRTAHGSRRIPDG